MKIRPLTPEHQSRAAALLRQAFPGSTYEAALVEKFHKNGTAVHEWVCIHIGKVVAYIAFSNAYHRHAVCGLHLAPVAVQPTLQRQGIGSELIRFSLRQDVIQKSTLFVLGDPAFYQRFGFEPCANPVCPFDKNNAHFLSMRNRPTSPYKVGYEAEF